MAWSSMIRIAGTRFSRYGITWWQIAAGFFLGRSKFSLPLYTSEKCWFVCYRPAVFLTAGQCYVVTGTSEVSFTESERCAR